MRCSVCGIEHNRRKYCSDECRKKRNYEASKEYQKQYWSEHRGRQKEIQKSFRENNKEQELERQKKWREDNREYEKERKKQYRLDQKEKYNIPDKFGGKNQSLLKGIIEELLILKSEEEVYFDWCRNPKTNYIMPVDIYIPQYNLIIEYHGQQHFTPISFDKKSSSSDFNAFERFFKQKERDVVKMNLILDNGFNFLIVPYWENLSKPNVLSLLNEGIVKRDGLGGFGKTSIRFRI